MKHIALQLEFETDKFRLTGPIPEVSNAGNQFYGEDFAKWLCKSLPQWHLDYLDEDWGWYVFSIRQETPKMKPTRSAFTRTRKKADAN